MTYEHLNSFCLFVGPNRSGTTVVGALLDAHPNALIGHEVDAFEDRGRTGRLQFARREDLFAKIVKNSARKAQLGRPGKRREGPVSYAVPGQHQGESERLQVIGTKRAQRTMQALDRNPSGLSDLQDQVELELKLIHVVRNPFDNIASMTPASQPRPPVSNYAHVTEQLRRIRSEPWPIHELALEDLIGHPESELTRLCEFFDLPVTREYLEACGRIILAEPNQSRRDRRWVAEDVASVRALVEDVPWLRRYRGTPIP